MKRRRIKLPFSTSASNSGGNSETTVPLTPVKSETTKKPSIVTPGPILLTPSLIASVNPDEDFKILEQANATELRPSVTLTTGQCFHWRAVDEADIDEKKNSAWGVHNASEWIGVIRIPNGESMVLSIRESTNCTLFRKLYGPEAIDMQSILYDYFQLEYNIAALYESWASNCPRLKAIAPCIPGLRIIAQDPWECLVSFICSSNNNIPRITKMVDSIRRQYGEPLIAIGDETFYSFPSLEKLKHATEDDLRINCGMGYRAKYLVETMNTLESLGGEKYLLGLREVPDPIQVQEKLCQFTGVGRKVADCVALFSLKQHDAIPVDIHVWNIALRDYDTEGILREAKSLTPTIYKQVGDLFRGRFTRMSGWAHSLLFVAELPSFRGALPSFILEEMDRFRDEEKARKQSKRKKADSGDESS